MILILSQECCVPFFENHKCSHLYTTRYVVTTFFQMTHMTVPKMNDMNVIHFVICDVKARLFPATNHQFYFLSGEESHLPPRGLLVRRGALWAGKKTKKLWREQSPWKTLVTYLPVSHRPLYENNPVPVWQDPEGMAWSLNKVFAHIQLQTLLCYNAALNFTSRDWLEKNNRDLLSDKKSAKRNFFPFVIETQTRNRSISEELNLQVEPLL